MGCFTVIRALLVRILFALHGVLAIWRLNVAAKDIRYWYLSLAIGGLFIETLVTLCKKRGQEWKWFCPSVLFYLLSVVPAIWFLELIELDKRIRNLKNGLNNTDGDMNKTESPELLSAVIKTDIGWKLTIRIPILLSSNQWIKTLEQVLLLLLIIGRWLLPKGKLTHDQLSQLLLVYIGTAADIVEFFDAFKEEKVRYNRKLCTIILAIWSWSLLQFTMVLTATRARKDQSGLINRVGDDKNKACCTPDVYGIVISIFMQDAPFLVLRLLLIFKYEVVSYTNMFFTSKNTLVIILLVYRLIVVQCTLRKQYKKQQREARGEIDPKERKKKKNIRLKESSSRQKLIHSYSLNDAVAVGSKNASKSPNGIKKNSRSYNGKNNGNIRYLPKKTSAPSSRYDELRVLPRRSRNRRYGYPNDRDSCYIVSETGSDRLDRRNMRKSDSAVNRMGHYPHNFDRFYTPQSTPPVDHFQTPATSPRLSRSDLWRNAPTSSGPSERRFPPDPYDNPHRTDKQPSRLRPQSVNVSDPWTSRRALFDR
ncbi:transmembrane protein 26-like [Tubulanus polymorphus]|uniref:transmembrane protein 26-like n=1 Tax=Tubulanus polymorphus TaxID=672921 RepID=UPI003DA61FFB